MVTGLIQVNLIPLHHDTEAHKVFLMNAVNLGEVGIRTVFSSDESDFKQIKRKKV